MQIKLIPEISPSGGYENIVRAVEVLSRYASIYPVSSPMAVNTAKIKIDNMTRHANLPTLIETAKRSVFAFQTMR